MQQGVPPHHSPTLHEVLGERGDTAGGFPVLAPLCAPRLSLPKPGVASFSSCTLILHGGFWLPWQRSKQQHLETADLCAPSATSRCLAPWPLFFASFWEVLSAFCLTGSSVRCPQVKEFKHRVITMGQDLSSSGESPELVICVFTVLCLAAAEPWAELYPSTSSGRS